MPTKGNEQKFRRDVIDGSELNYVKKMIHFYGSELDDLSRKLGEETEHSVVVTTDVLEKIEERLSDFEKREKKLVDNYRKCIRETEGVAV
jgi:hypothetical protein